MAEYIWCKGCYSSTLNALHISCSMNSLLTNHLMYADNIILLAPSVVSLQRRVKTYEKFVDSDDTLYKRVLPRT